jgi:RNA polymerase sigma factor (sigma-70 family)
MDIELLSDEALMKRVSNRDRQAFQVLYCRYEVRIFNFVVRCAGSAPLAEDLLQETFWRVWQAAGTFQPQKGGFRAWLYRVALNVVRTELARGSLKALFQFRSARTIRPRACSAKRKLIWYPVRWGACRL